MKFEDIKGNIKLHIGCQKEYLQDWINVNSNPANTEIECDATWDLSSIVFWQKESIDVIYAEDFLKDLALRSNDNDVLRLMLATYKHILKPNGIFIIGLTDSKYTTELAPWLKQIGFNKVLFFDTNDINDKKYLQTAK